MHSSHEPEDMTVAVVVYAAGNSGIFSLSSSRNNLNLYDTSVLSHSDTPQEWEAEMKDEILNYVKFGFRSPAR